MPVLFGFSWVARARLSGWVGL